MTRAKDALRASRKTRWVLRQRRVPAREMTTDLNEFADAVRACLGLGPMNRRKDEPHRRLLLEEEETIRFYRAPISWANPTGRTPLRGSSA